MTLKAATDNSEKLIALFIHHKKQCESRNFCCNFYDFSANDLWVVCTFNFTLVSHTFHAVRSHVTMHKTSSACAR